jgi:hypothetical protein
MNTATTASQSPPLDSVPLHPMVRLCECGHDQINHHNKRGACDSYDHQGMSPRIHVCTCKRFRKPNVRGQR